MAAKIMGIVNVTPDSFSDRGCYFDHNEAIMHALRLVEQGADLIDIGGESSRPDSNSISEKEESERVLPVIKALADKINVPISIDTVKVKVAEAAIDAGACFINDVSGFRDPDMIALAAEKKVSVCCMHMLGDPKTMQSNPQYAEGVVTELIRWMEERAQALTSAGIKEDKIVMDPGIGFGKTVAHNLEIIHNLHRLKTVGYPILLGASRKSFMTKITGVPPHELDFATVAVHAAGIYQGVDYIRVHNVAAHCEAVDVLNEMQRVARID